MQRRIAIWFLIPVLGLMIWWAGWNANNHHTGALPESSKVVQPPQPQPYTAPIGDAAFTVNASSSHNYQFSVPQDATSVRLQGHFSATGGSGNDIEVYLLTEDGFVNWRNGHQAATLYNSGKVTQGTLDVPLQSNGGTYFVVFSNSFSLLTPKAVEANLTLRYLR